MMKTFVCSMLTLALLAESKNVLKDKFNKIFRKNQKPNVKQDSSIEDGTISLNVGEILAALGVSQFVCQNPVGFSDFKAGDLEGTWYQVYASQATDSYGCLSYTITKVTDADSGDLPAIDINAAWSAYNTYWNPFLKGHYTQKYELFGDQNGRLFERLLTTRANTFSYIISSDYSTYFVEYSCKQTLADLWTIEYIDVFTKTGDMTGSS